MCLVIAFILAIFSFNAFAASNIGVGLLAAAGSLFFIGLMTRNILLTKKERAKKHRKEKKHDH